MNEDERVNKLFKTGGDALERFSAAHGSKDAKAQLEIMSALAGVAKELMAIRSEQLTALAAAMKAVHEATDESDRVAKLVEAFEFCAKLNVFAADELADGDVERAAVQQMYDIVQELDAIPPGRRPALAPLLDNPHPGVRASAGTWLHGIMPERALPVLREVAETELGASAGFTAGLALAREESKSEKP